MGNTLMRSLVADMSDLRQSVAMTVREHLYPIPSDAELLQMVGAATPHFALQIRERVASYAARLDAGDPRRATLDGHLAHLDRLAFGGEHGRAGQTELPPRPSLSPVVSAPDEALG